MGSAEAVAAALDGGPLTRKAWREATGYTSGTFDRRVTEAEGAELVEKNELGLWQKVREQPQS